MKTSYWEMVAALRGEDPKQAMKAHRNGRRFKKARMRDKARKHVPLHKRVAAAMKGC